MAQKIIITEASGFVGRQLIPYLMKEDCSLLLVGRDKTHLAAIFPDSHICDYTELTKCGAGYDTLVHLSAANNNSGLSQDDYFKVNSDFLNQVALSAKAAGIKFFINISTIHALDHNNTTAYAQSKRKGTQILEKVTGINIATVYLPLVYGNEWAGKIAWLNKLPRFLAYPLFKALSSLKPSVHVQRLAKFIISPNMAAKDSKIILSDNQDNNFIYRWTKRAVDLAFAVTVSLLLGWFLVLIWFAVRLESSGPGIFKQKRVGKNGKIFTCYKFRTMKQGTAQAGTHEISASAITKLGAFMRKTKIDELPQVWNIFRNEISLIGPRPCLPEQKELVEIRDKLGVFNIKPGISGLAQINNIDMSNPLRLAQKDAEYIALRSAILDLKILIKTATGSGQGDKIG